MAIYVVDGKEYSTSLVGLYIAHEYDDNCTFGLESIDGDLKLYFEKDPRYLSKNEQLIFLYAEKNNPNEPASLAYESWNPGDVKDATGELPVQLDENDRKYLKTLLMQHNSVEY